MTRLYAWLVATLAVAAGLAVPVTLAPAAHAATGMCTTTSGVSVVVDFAGLGGGVSKVCDTSGSTDAQRLFEAHHQMTYTQRYPGVVCTIDGKGDSACVNMPPADAYWGLWWSDGTDGQWHYSTEGVGSLSVPQGGSVAFAWQDSSSQTRPSVPPAKPAASSPSPSPTAPPSSSAQHPTSKAPSHEPAAPTGGGRATQSPRERSSARSGAPSVTPGGSSTPAAHTGASSHHTASSRHASAPATRATDDGQGAPSASSSSTTSPSGTAVSTTAGPSDTGGGGLPGWLAPALIGLLAVAGGAVALLRRRRA